jgi:hypothetical protein
VVAPRGRGGVERASQFLSKALHSAVTKADKPGRLVDADALAQRPFGLLDGVGLRTSHMLPNSIMLMHTT